MAEAKTKRKAEYGDFQTPRALAAACCDLLHELGVRPASIVEPTCGRGAFLFAAADRWPRAAPVLGYELDAEHVAAADAARTARTDPDRVRVTGADFFGTDWPSTLSAMPEPVLVIGNPPWVTSAHVGGLGGVNLPTKTNFKGARGLDAVTGKANFDISEYMLLKLISAAMGRDGSVAMLLKSDVARKVLAFCWRQRWPVADARLYPIDAAAHFGASVDAVLLVLRLGPGASPARTAGVYGVGSAMAPPASVIGEVDGWLIADLAAWQATRYLRGTERVRWRSGVKHDCADVVELVRAGQRYRNGLGELVELEDAYVYPMLKTSDVATGRAGRPDRFMIVTQQRVGQETQPIRHAAPKTWAYLTRHADRFRRRASSVYRGKPEFSEFGIGGYTFAPWKVAVSGMYKTLHFVPVGPRDGRPVVLDDVTYFLPCPSEPTARLLTELLVSKPAQLFYRSMIFWDAKRPVTIDLLKRLDLRAVAGAVGREGEYDQWVALEMSRPEVASPPGASTLFP